LMGDEQGLKSLAQVEKCPQALEGCRITLKPWSPDVDLKNVLTLPTTGKGVA
jgi:hypothetical protein